MPMLSAFAAVSIWGSGMCVSSVEDGDTIRLCSGEEVRIAGIDAPELEGSAKCEKTTRKALASSKNPAWCDYKLAEESREELKKIIASSHVVIKRHGKDTDGRTLATVYLDGRDAGNYLVTWGFARRRQE